MQLLPKSSTIINEQEITIVHSGSDYFSRLEQIIDQSIKEIHIQTYIFEYDAVGIQIIKALQRAILRKVAVYILLDGFGSRALSSECIAEMKRNGIHFRFFSPLFSLNSFYIGRRLHQKVVVVDGEILLIGGINIATKYKGTPYERPWLDYAVQVNSPIAKLAEQICRDLYFKKKTSVFRKKTSLHKDPNVTEIRILQNDWLNRKNEIYRAYIHAIEKAKVEVIIVGSYFFPSRKLTLALKSASEKKVKIKLILSGNSDIPLLKNATYFFYAYYLKNNIEIYEWNKSVLHGKAAVVDGNWSTIGSFNLNHLSSYASIEMNLGIHSKTFSEDFQLQLSQIIKECRKIAPDTIDKKKTIINQIKNRICYWLIKITLITITFFPYKRFMKLK